MRIIAGKWKGRRISTVPGARTRPTGSRVREAWMSILEPRLEGAVVADVFAGSGALGLEALSRGAAHVTFVERSGPAVGVLERNIETLKAGSDSAVVRAHALAHLRGSGARYDLVLADPPYGRGFAERLLALYRRSPFGSEFWVEHGADEPMPSGLKCDQRRYGGTMLTRASARPAGVPGSDGVARPDGVPRSAGVACPDGVSDPDGVPGPDGVPCPDGVR